MRPTSRRRFPSWQCATTYRKKKRESEQRLSLRFGAGLFIVSHFTTSVRAIGSSVLHVRRVLGVKKRKKKKKKKEEEEQRKRKGKSGWGKQNRGNTSQRRSPGTDNASGTEQRERAFGLFREYNFVVRVSTLRSRWWCEGIVTRPRVLLSLVILIKGESRS